MGEFELIRHYFAAAPCAQAAAGVVLGIGDDCALLAPAPGMRLAVSTDMLVAGTHFFADTDPEDLGWKTLAVNVSDLAAMGAQPRWVVLAASLPAPDEAWIAAFARGFFACSEAFGIDVIGGDTTRGPLNLCPTIFGEVPVGQAITRAGARPGDDLWISGAPGRAALGLAEPDAARRAYLEARGQPLGHPALARAAEALDALPPSRGLPRLELLLALDAWSAEQRSGTWRDFALFARGHTKQITEAEKTWLADEVGLADFRISTHTPLLRLKAPSVLSLPGGEIALGAMPDFAALTPASVAAIIAARQPPRVWHVVENLSSFERVARSCAADEGALWLPGYPPSWWQQAVATLLQHLPAPARIACDPDPDGIAIALQAGGLWSAAGLPWQAQHELPRWLEHSDA